MHVCSFIGLVEQGFSVYSGLTRVLVTGLFLSNDDSFRFTLRACLRPALLRGVIERLIISALLLALSIANWLYSSGRLDTAQYNCSGGRPVCSRLIRCRLMRLQLALCTTVI